MNYLRLFRQTLAVEYTQLEENAASYATERKGDALYLFFEKSNGATDWKNNLDFPAKPYREMEDLWFVHRGFLRVFKSIEPHIAALVSDKSVRRIVISGYSHGAALALLCHEYCVFHRPDIFSAIEGYGFGCPRVIWGKPCRRILSRFRNFTVIRNCRDLVTHLPPRIFGFRHAGKLLQIGKGRKYGAIGSHYPENYLTELRVLQMKKEAFEK